ncbi:MAG TPA: outer membrane protein assembly factor BamD [Sphingobacteriaceae bacterium]|nr:outer membrane protein assembly factor BamD [Sphingobacteriaceae bacterium]
MFKNRRILSITLCILLALGIAGCKSKFEKLRTGTDTAKKYQEALKLYNKKQYTKALTLFDDLVQRYKGRTEAEDLYFYYADTHYKLKDYTTARYHYKIFADTYPTSPKAEEARYMSAYCFYLESPNFSLDQDNTLKAIESLQLFINLYPKSERVTEASRLIQDLRDKLESKSYANAKLYLTIGDYQSAIIAFKNSLRDFPDTRYAEEMEFLMIESQYLYAKNSFETRQEQRFTDVIALTNEFTGKYPASKYLKNTEQFKQDSEKGIENVKKVLAAAQAVQKTKEVKPEETNKINNEQ